MHPLRKALPVLIASVCVAGLAAQAAAPAPASAAANFCRATPLPTLGNAHTEVSAGEPSGRYLVGWASDPGPGSEPVIHDLVWEQGVPRLLDTEAVRPYVDVRPTGVNQSGTVVGYRMSDYNTFHTDAWLYRDGRFTMLRGLSAADTTEPVAINSRGDVAGRSFSDDFGWRAVVWPADRPGTVRELTGWTFAFDIDEDGTVLGQVGPIPGGTPYVWPPSGAPYPLPKPPGFGDIYAETMSNGWVAGYGQRGDSILDLRWNLASHTVQVLPINDTAPLSVNRWGTIGAVGLLVRGDGRQVPLGPYARPLIVTDRDTAAGNDGQLESVPVTWTGCWTRFRRPS